MCPMRVVSGHAALTYADRGTGGGGHRWLYLALAAGIAFGPLGALLNRRWFGGEGRVQSCVAFEGQQHQCASRDQRA